MTNSMNLDGLLAAKRQLHLIFVLDESSSMSSQGKMNALNDSIRENIPEIKDAASECTKAQVVVRAVKFGSTANWHIRDAVPIESFQWVPLAVGGGSTALGKALDLVRTEALSTEAMGTRIFPPVIILVSDGQPTDRYEGPLQQLTSSGCGKTSIRSAIAIGNDAQFEPLQKFVGDSGGKVVRANGKLELRDFMREIVTHSIHESVQGSFVAPPHQSQPAQTSGQSAPVSSPAAAASSQPKSALPSSRQNNTSMIW